MPSGGENLMPMSHDQGGHVTALQRHLDDVWGDFSLFVARVAIAVALVRLGGIHGAPDGFGGGISGSILSFIDHVSSETASLVQSFIDLRLMFEYERPDDRRVDLDRSVGLDWDHTVDKE